MRQLLFGAIVGLAGIIAWGTAMATTPDKCPNTQMRVLVMGDSLADGLRLSLARYFAQCSTMQVVNVTAVSDGLAKTTDRDWLQRFLAKAGGAADPSRDIVVVQVGANDITTIRNGRTRESFNSDSWNALYQQRVKQLTAELSARSAGVFWFGLPVVGNASYEPSYQVISQLQADAVRKAGGRFIDIHQLTTFGTGQFSMSGKLGGRILQLRAADKVHFTKPGYDLIASQILGDITRLIADTNRRVALQDVRLQ